jgi:hypothetical protein
MGGGVGRRRRGGELEKRCRARRGGGGICGLVAGAGTGRENDAGVGARTLMEIQT